MMRWFAVVATFGGLGLACGDDGSSADADPNAIDATVQDGSTPDAISLADALPGTKRVFVTSTTSGGNLGRLAGADARCQAAGDDAGLGGTWGAWLSSPTVDAIDRLTGDGPWYGTDGSRVFADKAAVVDPFTDLEAGLWYDENGYFVSSDRIWTGTSASGTHVSSVGESCQVWTSEDIGDQARIGQAGRVGTEWTSFTFTTCNQTDARLICFEL